MPHEISGASIIFKNESGQDVSLNVEIANNFTKRKNGLMYRESLSEEFRDAIYMGSGGYSMHVDEEYLYSSRPSISR